MHSPKSAEYNKVFAALREKGRSLSFGIEKEVDSLHQLSVTKRILETIPFIFLYLSGASLTYIQDGISLLTFTGILLMGAALNSLGILIHEGLHGLLSKNHRLNHFLSFLVGIPLLISATAYQVTHANHHFELGKKLDYGTYKQHFRKSSLVWIAYFSQLLFGTILYVILIPPLAIKSASVRSRIFIFLEYSVIITFLMLIFTEISIEVLLLL